MKVLIDIPKKTYDQLNFLKEQGFGTMIDEIVANGIVLDNMTNGDVIKTITGEDFSKGASIYNHDLMICDGEYYLASNVDWWNAPYKEEIEETQR